MSRYALHLVDNEHMRAVRFIKGLVDSYFTALSSHIWKLSYAKVVNTTLEIETGKVDRKAAKEVTKKVKT